MVAVQVMANDVAVGLAASQGNSSAERVHAGVHLQLPPVRAAAPDCIRSFKDHCAVGITANRESARHNLRSLGAGHRPQPLHWL